MSIAQLGTALAEQWSGRDRTSLGYVVRLLVPTVQTYIVDHGRWSSRSSGKGYASF